MTGFGNASLCRVVLVGRQLFCAELACLAKAPFGLSHLGQIERAPTSSGGGEQHDEQSERAVRMLPAGGC